MPKYIDADRLLQELEDQCEDCLVDNAGAWCKHNCEYADLLLRLDHMPKADVVERKKGKWIKKVLNCGDRGLKETVYECSLCGVDFPDRACQWSYCPNCGAEMEKQDG